MGSSFILPGCASPTYWCRSETVKRETIKVCYFSNKAELDQLKGQPEAVKRIMYPCMRDHFTMDEAQCHIVGNYASGPMEIGTWYGVGQAIQNENTYNNCMISKGYYIAPEGAKCQ
jgi:hypothetical protein